MTPLSPSLLARVRQSLSSTEDEPTEREMWPWFTLAMLYAAGCAFLALRQAFASEYMLADDVREHVFWMFRYVDPRLFPQDPIADYFQSLAPPGYASLYWLLAQAGDRSFAGEQVAPFRAQSHCGRIFLRSCMALLPLPGSGHANCDPLFASSLAE